MVHARERERAQYRLLRRPPVGGDAEAAEGGFGMAVAGIGALALVCVALAADQGGYFPTSWGWATLVLASTGAIAAIVGSRTRTNSGSLLFAGALIVFLSWIGLSTWWSTDVAATVSDLERVSIYASAALLVPVAVPRRRADLLVGVVLLVIGCISAFSLATRLFPADLRITDTKALARLAQPIGYWNGLACFAAVGILLAVGQASTSRRVVLRCASAAAVVVLSTTVYFTFSRAAWVALGAGCAVAIALTRDRLRFASTLLLVGGPAVAAVLLASRNSRLTTAHVSVDAGGVAGRHLALQLFALCAVAAAGAALLPTLAVTLAPFSRLRRAYTAALILAPVALAVAALAHGGGPVHLARASYDSFRAPPPDVTNLNDRLLNFSGDGRAQLWRLAWENFRSHPLVGSGGGSYQRYFLAHQPPTVGSVTDAHNLYLETASELGVVGLALLLVALVLPLASLPRAGRRPLVAHAAGAYVVFLAHVAADWDWELPAVTLPAIVLGSYLVRSGSTGVSACIRRTTAAIPVAAALVVIGAVGVGGNSALAASVDSRHDGNIGQAIADAQRARTWMPWSAAPWQALGLAEVAAGKADDAREALRHAATMDPGNWEVWAELARITSGVERAQALKRAASLFVQGDFSTPSAGGQSR